MPPYAIPKLKNYIPASLRTSLYDLNQVMSSIYKMHAVYQPI